MLNHCVTFICCRNSFKVERTVYSLLSAFSTEMLWEFLALVAVAVVTGLIYLITYARGHYGELEKLGIPVVKPHFYLGSNPNFYKIHNHFQDLEWLQTYGEVYGSYEGRVPTINVCDPDIVRQITIKDFDHFRNHNFHDFVGSHDETIVGQFLDFLKDDAWKTVRSLMSPTFTTSKLKKMTSKLRDVSEEFVKQTKENLYKSNDGVLENISIHQEVFTMITDLIARITLNIKIENPKDPNNDFAKAMRDLFANSIPSYVIPYTRTFPFLRKYFRSTAHSQDLTFFGTVFRKVMNERKTSGQRQEDFVDFLNDFRDRTESDLELKKLGVTEATVIASAVEFFIGGQEAMSTAISMLCYYLTQNPVIERKLYAEIDSYTKKHNGRIDHDNFGDLQYLNACLSEVLRLHPGFSRPERLCNKDWEYNGLRIMKGMVVVFPLWAYHRNPKYFPDPEKFDPERFMPQSQYKLEPMAYAAFGHGPRMCIGMRFAFECLTMISIYIFKNFQFKSRPETKVSYIPGSVLSVTMGPMMLDLIERNEAQ